MEASSPAKRPYTYTTARSFRSKIPRIGNELGLGWYDYGARMLNPTIGRWNGVDALADSFLNYSPFVYTLNNPVIFIDPDGRTVVAPGEEEQQVIRNTLKRRHRKYVEFDENGTLNTELLSKARGNSGNLEALNQLANDETVFELSVTEGFDYRDENGNPQHQGFGPITQGNSEDTSPFSPTTGEEGFMGQTQFPEEGAAFRSPDGNVRININSGLSEQGQAEMLAHEGYGHAYLYSKGEPHSHQPEVFDGGGFREGNRPLAKQIADRIIETAKNFRKR